MPSSPLFSSRSKSMTSIPDADPVATPILAFGCLSHHARITRGSFFASLHPCGVYGFFVDSETGKTAHPRASA